MRNKPGIYDKGKIKKNYFCSIFRDSWIDKLHGCDKKCVPAMAAIKKGKRHVFWLLLRRKMLLQIHKSYGYVYH